MQTITNLLKLLTLAIFLFIGFSTQLFADSVETYYFNGMNTNYGDARKELKAIKDLIRNGRYYREMRNFNPQLMYTSTNGVIMDGTSVFFGAYKRHLEAYAENERKFCSNNSPEYSWYSCYFLEYDAQKELRKILTTIKNPENETYMIPNDGKNYLPLYGNQIISYSRGNIVANVVQDYFTNGYKIKRINIASPDKFKYGKVFTSTADFVIGKFTSGKVNYHPRYYHYLSSKEEDRFRRSWYYTKEYNQRFFYWNTPGLYGRENLEAVKDGHNLNLCYLNRKYGLGYQIEKQIYQDYKRLGGK